MEKKLQHMEELLEQSLDAVTSRPLFLTTVSTMLNLNSYRKIWFRKTMEALWKDLELPVRRDQDKLLHHIEELTLRIKKLEMELRRRNPSEGSSEKVEKKTKISAVPSKNVSKIAAGAELDLQ